MIKNRLLNNENCTSMLRKWLVLTLIFFTSIYFAHANQHCDLFNSSKRISYSTKLNSNCVEPTAQPTNLVLTKSGIIINGTFTVSNPTADKYLILRNIEGQTPNVPVNGNVYAVGQNNALNAYVVSYGSSTTFQTHYNQGVRGNNAYTFTIYAVNSECTGGPIYLVTNPLVDSITNCPITLNGITASAATSNSFTLSWPIGENGNALPMNRILEVATDLNFTNMVSNSPFTLGTEDISLNITGLNPNTKYYFRGKNATTICESDYATVGNIFTTCLPAGTFYETFDQVTGNVLPNCWSKITVGDSSSVPTVNVTSTYANSAPNGVTFYGNGADMTNLNNKAILVSPELSNVGQGTHRLRFSAKMSSSGGTYDLQVVALSSNTADTEIELIGTITSSELTPSYQEFSVNFNNYSGNANYIGIRRINGSSYSYLCVDDLIWEPIPTCPELQSAAASNPTIDGATVSWIDSMGTPTNGYEYFISLTNNMPSENEIFETTTNSTIQVSGLSNGTYYVFVRRACSNDDKSPWRQTTFSTIPTAPVPWLEEFGNTTPSGWTISGWSLGTASGYPGNPGMNLHKNLYGSGSSSSGTFTTIPVGPLNTNNYELSFDYRQVSYNSPYAPLTTWGNFTIEISTDFGQTWSQIGIVEDEQGEENGAYIHKIFSLQGYQSEYVKIRISATRTSGDYYLSFDNFQIKQPVVPIENVIVTTENNINPEILSQNGTLQLLAAVNPISQNQEVTWSIVSGEEFATINQNGVVTAVANGVVLVRATSVADLTKFDEISVTIEFEEDQTEYCIPTFFYPSSADEIVVNNISLSGETLTWNVNPVLYNEAGYADYTNSESVDLLAGNQYVLNFHSNWQNPNYVNVRAWVDYNNNFVFDNEEEIGYYNTGITSTGDGSFEFTVPQNTTPGLYRLRVMLQFPNSAPDNLHACGTINSYGIAIDYNLQVIESNIIQDDYCEVTVEYGVEPITLVNFSDLNNSTSATVDGTPAYENFTSKVANVVKETSYNLTVKGNTNGNFEHDIRVFIDWNHDFTFDMETEYYTASLLPSTGTDEVNVIIPILIPADAIVGNTRMRIIKDQWNIYEAGEFNACTDAYYGQIEDYTIQIQDATASVKPFDKTAISIYPNPSTGIFNISTEILLDRIEVYNVAGQQILTSKAKEVDLTEVSSGVYLLKIFATNGTQNVYKVIKK